MKDFGIFEGDRAQNYDRFIQNWMPNYNSLLACLPDLLASRMMTDDNDVLIVGSGTGNELLSLASTKKDWQFLGVDPSPQMLIQAHQKLKHFSNVQLQEGYVKDLSDTKHFQAATLLLVLHFLPDDGSKLNLLKNIADRLVAGAPFVMAGIFGAKQELLNNLEVLKTMIPLEFEQHNLHDRLEHIRDNIQYIPEQRLIALFEEAGFHPPTRFFQMAIWGAWISTKK